jgi:hypothetical protein
MDTLGTILAGVGGLLMLVCHIVVILKMFQKGETGLAIVAIVLTFCGGLGLLLTLIYGWFKAAQWNIRNIMIAYTIGWVLGIAGNAMNPGHVRDIQGRFQQ